MLFLVLGLAGCTSDRVDGDPQGDFGTEIFDAGPGGLPNATAGRVFGSVLHPAGYPIPDVRVIILGFDSSRITNATGAFEFAEVPAGKHTIRAEKSGYRTVQRPFEVVAAKALRVEIILESATAADDNEHFHDHWRGADTYTILDTTVKLDDDISRVPPKCVYTWIQYPRECEYIMIYPEPGVIVPPGTSNLTVEITIDPGAGYRNDSVDFNIYPPPDANGNSPRHWEVFRTPHHRFVYELPRPDLVDNGHSEWSDWSFEIRWSNLGGTVYQHLLGSSIHVEVTANRGVLELDPPHERFWAETDRIEATGFSEGTHVACTLSPYRCYERSPVPRTFSGFDDGTVRCHLGCMVMKPGNTIPPGTTRLQFTVEHYWTAPTYAPPAASTPFERPQFVIGYKTAAADPRLATWDDYTWLEPVSEETTDRGVAWTFEVQVHPDQTDTYYRKISHWTFQPAVPGHEDASTWEGIECPQSACGDAVFELTRLTAINDQWPGQT